MAVGISHSPFSVIFFFSVIVLTEEINLNVYPLHYIPRYLPTRVEIC